MYRINLYPAGQERRAARRTQLRRSAGYTLVLGAQTLFLGLFALSALTAAQRVRAVEEMVAAGEKRLVEPQQPGSRVPILQARKILQRKAERKIWSPVLAAVARHIPDNLILDRIEASLTPRAEGLGMTLTGRLRTGRDMEPVVEFSRLISASPEYRCQFSEAKVDRLDTSGDVARFTVVCPLIVPSGDQEAEEKAGG